MRSPFRRDTVSRRMSSQRSRLAFGCLSAWVSPSGAARRLRPVVPSGPRNRSPDLHHLTYRSDVQNGIDARNMALRLGMRFLHTTRKGRVNPAPFPLHGSLVRRVVAGLSLIDHHPPASKAAKRPGEASRSVDLTSPGVHFFCRIG